MCFFLQKKLPKLESQLYALVDEYERVNKKTFLIKGYSLREFIGHIRENYEIEKENMKIARVTFIFSAQQFYCTDRTLTNKIFLFLEICQR